MWSRGVVWGLRGQPGRCQEPPGRAAVRGSLGLGGPKRFWGSESRIQAAAASGRRGAEVRAGWSRGVCTHTQPIVWVQRDAGSALALLLVLVCGWMPATVLVPGTRWLGQQQISSGSSSPNPAL